MSSYSCCDQTSKESKKIKTLASILKIVSEESRLKLLCVLSRGEHCVCELMDHNSLSQSLISHHLRDLKDANIVKSRKIGLRVYYTLTTKGKRITNQLFKI